MTWLIFTLLQELLNHIDFSTSEASEASDLSMINYEIVKRAPEGIPGANRCDPADVTD